MECLFKRVYFQLVVGAVGEDDDRDARKVLLPRDGPHGLRLVLGVAVEELPGVAAVEHRLAAAALHHGLAGLGVRRGHVLVGGPEAAAVVLAERADVGRPDVVPVHVLLRRVVEIHLFVDYGRCHTYEI